VKKDAYRDALRLRLRGVPLETRRKWNETDLMVWWNRERQKDTYLTWERAPGDPWQHVKGMCSDLIGPKAI
jgi:hypothetical protein